MNSICVFCGSQSGKSPVYTEEAQKLGRLIAQLKFTLVYGGGQVGLMGVVSNAALDAGGEVTGVIPKALFGKELANKKITKLHVVNSMHERKQLMYTLADGFVALPGGLGTFDEFFEVLTWAQLGLHHKPCGLLNVAQYFDPLLKMLDKSLEEGLLKESSRQMIITDSDVESLFKKMRAYKPPKTEKWITHDET